MQNAYSDAESAPVFIRRVVSDEFQKLRQAARSNEEAMGPIAFDYQQSALGAAEPVVSQQLEHALCGNNPALRLGPPVSMADMKDRVTFAMREIQRILNDSLIHNPMGDTTVGAQLYSTLPKVINALSQQVMEYGRNTMQLPNGGYRSLE